MEGSIERVQRPRLSSEVLGWHWCPSACARTLDAFCPSSSVRSLFLSRPTSQHPASWNLKQYFEGSEWRIRESVGTCVARVSMIPECLCRSEMTNGRALKVCNPFIDFKPALLLFPGPPGSESHRFLGLKLCRKDTAFLLARHLRRLGQNMEPITGEIWFMFPMETNSLPRADGWFSGLLARADSSRCPLSLVASHLVLL